MKIITIFLSVFVLFISLAFSQSVDELKQEIYPKLRDKRCQDSLDKCDCPDAKEMKAYIEALLETGTAKDEIFYKVAKKFSLNTILDVQVKQELEKRFIKDAGVSYPRLILEPNSFNFGKVNKRQVKISKIFKIYNRGKIDLALNNIRVSCGCVSVSLKNGKDKSSDFGVAGSPIGWQATIKPQKSAEFIVTLDLLHSSMGLGKQPRDVFIASNDPIYPQTTLKVEIEVIE